jgi:hypothetical protein
MCGDYADIRMNAIDSPSGRSSSGTGRGLMWNETSRGSRPARACRQRHYWYIEAVPNSCIGHWTPHQERQEELS